MIQLHCLKHSQLYKLNLNHQVSHSEALFLYLFLRRNRHDHYRHRLQNRPAYYQGCVVQRYIRLRIVEMFIPNCCSSYQDAVLAAGKASQFSDVHLLADHL